MSATADRPLLVGIETGGTKVVAAVADAADPERILATTILPTRGPAETLADLAGFVSGHGVDGTVAAVGVASFGPLDIDPGSPTYGHLTSTPKLGWEGTDVLGPIGAAAPGARLALVTDVNGAALGEARWGAGTGVDDFVYLTVGTGVGGGVIAGGRLLAGSGWPEVAHLLPRRHPEDGFAGTCPFHGDCLEGLVAGPAISARWGVDGSRLGPEEAAANLRFSSYYLAQLVTTLAYVAGVRLAVVGGGVSKTPGLVPAVEAEVERLMGAPGATGTGGGRIRIVRPALGDESGVRGAISLAESLLA
ncbi:fructokinase [Rathayibacter sp. AY1D2]|uniref:ROK family protein n=1 Tax=unclassified Rathayibacter TaxID=2609250 RepID=UPI000CE83A9C|nr:MULTISPECIES: ROK family protein [unclassified Rathayibacter]PPG59634.1 fructokinase [Rathayibacter sp. AY1C7]PPH49461.1 fructokinase [Rathayibacter sp. AY1E1]PPI07859.1 fructokinase [Rathayibacter sp. AY1D2]